MLQNTIQRSTTWAVIGLTLLFLWPTIVSAETVVRTGHSVSVGASQIVENDFYAAGNNITHSGQVREDLYAVAGSITINGPVGQDLTVVGGTVQVHAPVGDDVRVLGGDVVIAGQVGGDVFVIGGLLKILSSATVAGNVYFYGGDADIEGAVDGLVMGRAETVTINSAIGGTDMVVGRLGLGDRAVVTGDVRYIGSTDIDRAPGASVTGAIVPGTAPEAGGRSRVGLVFAFAWVFTALCFFLLLRSQLENLVMELRREPVRIGLIGAGLMVGLPVLSLVLLATVLGAWIGFVLLLITLLVLVICFIIMPILLGGYLARILLKRRRFDVLSVVLGIATLLILSYVPLVGYLLIAFAFLMTLGVVGSMFYKRARNID